MHYPAFVVDDLHSTARHLVISPTISSLDTRRLEVDRTKLDAGNPIRDLVLETCEAVEAIVPFRVIGKHVVFPPDEFHTESWVAHSSRG
jgi:hypothetical protein